MLGGIFGASAASNAAQTQAQASQSAIRAQENQNQITQGELRPFLNTGTGALNTLWDQFGAGNVLGTTPQQFAGLGAPPGLNLSPIAGAGPPTPDGVPNLNLQGPGTAPQLNLTLPTDRSLTSQFQQSPGYQYELGQQQNAIQNSAAGRSGALSGNMLQALQQNAQGLASQDYWTFYNALTQGQLGNYNAQNQNFWNTYNANTNAQLQNYNAADQNFWNRWDALNNNYWSQLNANIQTGEANYNAANNNYWNQYNAANQFQTNEYNRLFGIAGMGQNAAVQGGAAGLQAATNIGQAQIGAGNAIAAGQIGGAQALTGGINNALGNFFGGINSNPISLGGGFMGSAGASGPTGAPLTNDSSTLLSYLFGSSGAGPFGGTSTNLPFGQGGDYSSAGTY